MVHSSKILPFSSVSHPEKCARKDSFEATSEMRSQIETWECSYVRKKAEAVIRSNADPDVSSEETSLPSFAEDFAPMPSFLVTQEIEHNTEHTPKSVSRGTPTPDISVFGSQGTEDQDPVKIEGVTEDCVSVGGAQGRAQIDSLL